MNTITHGTPRGYSFFRCRCDECRAAGAAYYASLKNRKRIGAVRPYNKKAATGRSTVRYDGDAVAVAQNLQQGECAICTRVLPLEEDHSHVTHRFRGLLCRTCNVGIGALGDDPETLMRAVKYLTTR